MAHYDFLVVGCGMFGATFAQQMAKRGRKVLVIEKRPHIGGRSSIQVSAKKRMMVYSSLLTYLRKYRGRFATRMFSLIFKLAVIIKEILNVFSGIVAFPASILLHNSGKWSKAIAKTRSSAIFLVRYSWRFLFKT